MANALLMRAFNQYGYISPSSVLNHSLDANNDGVALLFQANSTDAITHLGFRYGLRTGTPPVYSIRLESPTTSGIPDDADIGGGSATAATFTPPASTAWDGTWQWVALTNSYTPTLGQFLFATIRYSSGTVDASNFSSFGVAYPGIMSVNDARSLPAMLTMAAGSWTKTGNTGLLGYRTASGRYGLIAISEYTTLTANTATHKSGMHFTLASGYGDTFKLAGLAGMMKLSAAGGSCKVGIWDTSGTELASVTIDGDYPASVAGPNVFGEVYFTTQPTLSYGTKYYIGIEVVSGAVGVNGIVMAEAADRSWFPNGTSRGLVTFDGSTWTETDTVMPLLDIIFADITEPSGGGGGGMIVGTGPIVHAA